MDITYIQDIFAYLDRHEPTANTRYRKILTLTSGLHDIPEPVSEVRIFIPPPGRVDAVLVMEHRNLGEVILQKTVAVENFTMVMTSGYSDSAVKEFLHMLSVNERLVDASFLYFEDHDVSGF